MSQKSEFPLLRGITDKLNRSVRDLRISVTDRCNFRCTYCMPAEIFGERYEFLPRPHILTFEEIERLARLFSVAGVSKLRITGGEPLVRANLPDLISKLSAIDGIDDIALTTNGYLLATGSCQHARRHQGCYRTWIFTDQNQRCSPARRKRSHIGRYCSLLPWHRSDRSFH